MILGITILVTRPLSNYTHPSLTVDHRMKRLTSSSLRSIKIGNIIGVVYATRVVNPSRLCYLLYVRTRFFARIETRENLTIRIWFGLSRCSCFSTQALGVNYRRSPRRDGLVQTEYQNALLTVEPQNSCPDYAPPSTHGTPPSHTHARTHAAMHGHRHPPTPFSCAPQKQTRIKIKL